MLIVYIKNNFYSVLLFSVRKSIKSTWLNEKDEYIAPNEEHEHLNSLNMIPCIFII